MADSAPLEVLDQIFFSLSITTLKSVGFVCRSFHHAADKYKFRELLLLPKAESFDKLRKISTHPRLKYYVKSVVYSGNMLMRYQDYDDWSIRLIQGTSRPLDDDYEYTKSMSCQQFDETELEQRYARYCFWVEREKRAQSNGNAKRWMSEAFSLLPNLASMTLARRLERNWAGNKVKPPGRIARESLCEPSVFAGTRYYPNQFGDLVRAAHGSGVSLERLDGSGICWRGFEGYSESLAQIVKGVSHLSLEFEEIDGATRERRYMLREVVKTASDLQTLEISFILSLFYERPVYERPIMELSQFLPHHRHWPSLKRLKLEVIATTQLALVRLLSCHATTLRSLELGYIDFDWREAEDGTFAGSWTDMIHFLQEELSLKDVSLHGRLSSPYSEDWDASTERWWRYCNNHERDAQLPPLEETLKFRIERYIVEGGVCPLDDPDGGDDFDRETYWHAIEDYSWHLSCKTANEACVWGDPHPAQHEECREFTSGVRIKDLGYEAWVDSAMTAVSNPGPAHLSGPIKRAGST